MTGEDLVRWVDRNASWLRGTSYGIYEIRDWQGHSRSSSIGKMLQATLSVSLKTDNQKGLGGVAQNRHDGLSGRPSSHALKEGPTLKNKEMREAWSGHVAHEHTLLGLSDGIFTVSLCHRTTSAQPRDHSRALLLER